MGWGSPPQFKKRRKRLCHWKSVWRAILGPNPAIFRKETTHAFVCPCLCFVLVISCFLGKLFVRDPSLAQPIQGKRGLGCTGVGESKVFSRQDQRVRGGTGVMLAGGLQAISAAPYPCCFIPPPHPRIHQGQLGSSDRKPPNILESCQGCVPPTKGSACLGEGIPSFPLRAPPERGQRCWPLPSLMELGGDPGWHRQVEGLTRPGRWQGLAGMRRRKLGGGRNWRGGRQLEWRPPPGFPCPLGLGTSIGFGTSGAA